ncbi:hypothetical protein PS15m_011111 [Mucor circinelloides]
MLFSQMFSFFHNNKKRTTPSKQPSPPAPTTATSTTLDPSSKSSFTSSVSNEQPLTPLSPPPQLPAHHASVAESDIQIPQVEFEQSRSLLQLDFFGPDQQQLSTDFPQFDHLLNKAPSSETETPETKEHSNKFGTLNRKLTKTLRHRLSLRPNQTNKRVKRSISTPNLV